MSDRSLEKNNAIVRREGGQQRKILVITSEPEFDRGFTSIMDESGLLVIIATDRRGAISKLAENHPDVAVMDCTKATDCADTIAKIRDMKFGTRIIAIIDESVSPASIQEIEKHGIELFMRRPISPPELVRAVIAIAGLKAPSAIINK